MRCWMFEERVTLKLAIPYVKQIATGTCCITQGIQIGALWQSRGVGGGERWRKVQEGGDKGGDMGVPMADSCWCLTENNKIL